MTLRMLIAVMTLAGALGAAGAAAGDTQLVVESGWEARPANGRWLPFYVTASDPRTRNVTLNIEWPVGGSYAMHIQQAMTIDASPRTFPILLPVSGWGYQQSSFRLSDRDTGKTLAVYPAEGETPNFFPTYADASAPYIGVSGAGGITARLGSNVNVAFLTPRRLPTTALGYDCLDVLVLNAPNLAPSAFGPQPIDAMQQQAIVDWVRAGGNLVIWSGDSGLASGPLADSLPAKVGPADTLTLTHEDLAALGLPDRFKTLPVHRLDAAPGADMLPLLNRGQAIGCSGRLGLGRITILPLDMAQFPSADTAARELWKPVFKGMLDLPEVAAIAAAATQLSYGTNADRQETATMQVADILGDVPGAGSVGFGYVAWIMLGMAVVVGPVDWFVLKKLGRQSWTWVTTAGWIALVTVAAVFAGQLFKSGDLHYRTLQSYDQAGDSVVASTQYVGLYAPRTQTYDIHPQADGWWQPTGFADAGASGLFTDEDFHQTTENNLPQPMVVSVWSLRFMRGDAIEQSPAMVKADLHNQHNDDGSVQLVGSLANLTDQTMFNVRVSELAGTTGILIGTAGTTPDNTPMLRIPPHGSISINVALHAESMLSDASTPSYPPYYSRYGGATQQVAAGQFYRTVGDLNERRGRKMLVRVMGQGCAIVYAQLESPPPPATLATPGAHEQHDAYLRALVDLRNGNDK